MAGRHGEIGSGNEYCLCNEHSGVQANIINMNMKLCAQQTKVDSMLTRINVILGSVCLSLILIIVDIVLRFGNIKN